MRRADRAIALDRELDNGHTRRALIALPALVDAFFQLAEKSLTARVDVGAVIAAATARQSNFIALGAGLDERAAFVQLRTGGLLRRGRHGVRCRWLVRHFRRRFHNRGGRVWCDRFGWRD